MWESEPGTDGRRCGRDTEEGGRGGGGREGTEVGKEKELGRKEEEGDTEKGEGRRTVPSAGAVAAAPTPEVSTWLFSVLEKQFWSS